MTQNSEIRNRLFEQFSKTVVADGWRELSCASIASEAKIEVKTAFVEYRNRYTYVSELIHRIDTAMLDSYDGDMVDEPARERLFDVMMSRFEALQSHRELVVALTKAARRNPMLSLHLMALSRITADWFMDVAHISPAGVGGIVRRKGALLAYARTFGVWLKDDTEDMSKTMAMLDKTLKSGEKALKRAEKLACLLPRRGKSCRSSKKASDEDNHSSEPADMTSVDDGPMAPMPS